MKPSPLTSRLLTYAAADPTRLSYASRQFARMIRLVRRGMIAVGVDSPSRVQVRGLETAILVPFSHQMPVYRAIHPRYDALLLALAEHIRQREPLAMVDVGANVGDSILAAHPRSDDTFIAFEPHSAFIDYLRHNLAVLQDIAILTLACGSSDGDVVLGEASRGTAGSSMADGGGLRVASTTLDSAVAHVWNGRLPNFVKIDTDGFDTDVIDGAMGTLSKRATWLLYECDIRLTQGGAARHVATLRSLRAAGYVSAAAFSNTGEFLVRLDLDDEGAWSSLLDTQSATGPVYYHDLLLSPNESNLTVFLRQLPDVTHAA